MKRGRGWWLRSIPPPQHRACASGDAEHKGKECHGVLSPLGRELLEERWSRGASLQRLCRLLCCVIVGTAHLQTIGVRGRLARSVAALTSQGAPVKLMEQYCRPEWGPIPLSA